MAGKGNAAGLAALLAAALLLGGCNGENGLPVNNPEHSSPAIASTAPVKPTPTPDSTALEATETPPPVEQPRWDYPLTAGELFGGQGLPGDFLLPLHLWEDGSQFLFATADGRVLRARWNGLAYTSEPVAEQLDTGNSPFAYVDGGRQRLYAGAARRQAGGEAGRAIVMVDLATTERGDLFDLAGWRSGGLALAREFQAAGGLALARLRESGDVNDDSLNKWVVIDPEKKECATIDLTGFAAQRLPLWEKVEGVRLAILDGDRMLAVWSVRGSKAPGQEDPGKTAVLAFELDRAGAVVRELGAVRGGEPAILPAIAGGTGFSPSPDGLRLVYGGEHGGVYLYDVQANEERALEGGAAKLAFSQWTGSGALLYGVGAGAALTVHRVAPAGAPSPTPQPTATPAQ